jgi:phosphohistidine phosphatase
MKTLMLLRHGLAARPLPGQGDFERHLTNKGRAQALWLAGRLQAQPHLPDCLLCSSAQRARETCDLILDNLPPDRTLPKALYKKELYLAAPDRLLRILQDLPESCQRVLLVGHNPGLHVLAAYLSGPSSDKAALKSLYAGLPEAALCTLAIADLDWRGLGQGAARLLSLQTPPR